MYRFNRKGLCLVVLLMSILSQVFSNETMFPELAEKGKDYKVKVDLNSIAGIDTISMMDLTLVISKPSNSQIDETILTSIVAFNEGVIAADLYVSESNDTGYFSVEVYHLQEKLYGESNVFNVVDQSVKRIISSNIPTLLNRNSVNSISLTCSGTRFTEGQNITILLSPHDSISTEELITPYIQNVDITSTSTLSFYITVPRWATVGYYSFMLIDQEQDSIYYGDSILIHESFSSPDFSFDGVGEGVQTYFEHNDIVTYGLRGENTAFLSATNHNIYLIRKEEAGDILAEGGADPLSDNQTFLDVQFDVKHNDYIVVTAQIPDFIDPGTYYLFYYNEITGLLENKREITVDVDNTMATQIINKEAKGCCDIIINDSKISLQPITPLEDENIEMSIYSITGVAVFSESMIVNESVVLPENLNGIYLISYTVGDQIYTESILIKD